MIAVRNNWIHLSTELPGKNIILTDLHTISSFFHQFLNEDSITNEIRNLTSLIEKISIGQNNDSIQSDALSETYASEITEKALCIWSARQR